MGGGRKFMYPHWVWSPAGGWWPSPAAWKRNTAMYAVFMVCALGAIGITQEVKVNRYERKKVDRHHGDAHDTNH